MLLSELRNNLTLLAQSHPDEVLQETEITNISFDTRTVTQGSLFVCIKGIRSDRHEYIQEAIEKGAVAIVSEYSIDTKDAINLVVENTNTALSYLSAAFYNNPQNKLRVVGVTGTNGKTTVTNLVKNMLEVCGYKVGLIGTNEIVIDKTSYPANATTPEAPELFSYLGKMAEENCDFAVMEVSSHSVSLGRVAAISFEIGVFTNLTQDHLDYHITMENYANAKAEFFRQCKTSVINADSPYAEIMKAQAADTVITYGINEACDYRASEIEARADGVSYTVLCDKDPFRINFPIPGGFSVYNSLAVCALSGALSIPDGFVRMALKKTKTVKGRCELVEIDKPYQVMIDFAHTPDGMENILSTVNEFKPARLITVFGCGGDRDKGKRPKMGAIAKKYSDLVVVTSDNPRSENMNAIIEDILAGISDLTNVYSEPDRKKAIGLAMSLAQEKDIILLLGKGHEMVQKFKDYEIEFDEREVVKSLCN
ncbi:MAG: UDP-N-acetylmuramoyl-L-alanyl-D-glutamate--2,6-diaminopimelate ligase [Clostridia bacterium]|nr:UDP-N-acetylmuramoyl-L-alanyl-D-glutamate--2,6-diaminopimelate ligase [Clostridia bacterium]